MVRHVLGLSGGKDSSALAVYMKDRVPDMEYYFCDTGKELPETYEYIKKLEILLGKPIDMLNADRDFDHWMWVNKGLLPSAQLRWCTPNLKIKPFEMWVGEDEAISYIGIRADENREGYISSKKNIKPVYPFKEDGITRDDVFKILEDSGLGLPKYYEWRTRSGCYFCFFQRQYEWVQLAERHPDLFQKAVDYENKVGFESAASEKQFTWTGKETLTELLERKDEIIEKHNQKVKNQLSVSNNNTNLASVLENVLDSDDDTPPCLACHI